MRSWLLLGKVCAEVAPLLGVMQVSVLRLLHRSWQGRTLQVGKSPDQEVSVGFQVPRTKFSIWGKTAIQQGQDENVTPSLNHTMSVSAWPPPPWLTRYPAHFPGGSLTILLMAGLIVPFAHSSSTN